jgi:preprotein translocase subunit YajC
MFGALIVGMYFLLIRPQQKRRRDMLEQQRNIQIGDEIITIGGLYGKVVALDDATMTLQIADGVTVRYAREAFGRRAKPQDSQDDSAQPGSDETGKDDSV